MSVEDRIRAATKATASTVRAVRPLTPPDDLPAAAPSGRRRPLRTGRGTWLVPLAAAAAVLAVAASLVAVKTFTGALDKKPSSPAVPAGIPRYFVSLVDGVWLTVRDDRTGKVTGQVTTWKAGKPTPYTLFQAATGAADDRTFVAVGSVTSTSKGFNPARAGKDYAYGWYLVHVTPGTTPGATLSPLPIAGPPKDWDILGLALSPDGRTLAVMSQPNGAWGNQAGRPPGRAYLSTYAVPTGKLLRTWTGPQIVAESNGLASNGVGLTWEPNGRTLTYNLPGAAGTRHPLQALDVNSPAGAFTGGGRAVATLPAPWICDYAALSANGKTVLCGTAEGMLLQCPKSGLAITSYAATTGEKEGAVYRYPADCDTGAAYVLWTGQGGTAIVVALAVSTTGTSRTETSVFGAIGPAGFTKLSIGGYIPAEAFQPGIIAF